MDGDAAIGNMGALQGYVQRVANLHETRDEVNGDIREVYREAKDAGFDTTILREIVKEYRTDGEARQSRYALLDQYRQALGMLAGTPLGEAAMHGAAELRVVVDKPRPFAEQPLHRRPGRPRKPANTDPYRPDPLDAA